MGRPWFVRIAALLCSLAAIVLATFGIRLLFAGDWLESHEVRYGALTLLGLGVLASAASIALAIVGAARRPRLVGSWIVVAMVLVPVPLAVVLAQALGL